MDHVPLAGLVDWMASIIWINYLVQRRLTCQNRGIPFTPKKTLINKLPVELNLTVLVIFILAFVCISNKDLEISSRC